MRPNDHEIEMDPGPPNHDDACPVCDRIECECPMEDDAGEFKGYLSEGAADYSDGWRSKQ